MAARSHLETDTEAPLRAEAEQQGYRLVRANTKTLDAECVPHEFKYRLEIPGKAGEYRQDLSDPYGVWGRLNDVRAYLNRLAEPGLAPAEPAAVDPPAEPAADAPATADAAPVEPVAASPKAEAEPVDPMAIPDFLRRAPAARAEGVEPRKVEPAAEPGDSSREEFKEDPQAPAAAAKEAALVIEREDEMVRAEMRRDAAEYHAALARSEEEEREHENRVAPKRAKATVSVQRFIYHFMDERGMTLDQVHQRENIVPAAQTEKKYQPLVRALLGKPRMVDGKTTTSDATGELSKIADVIEYAVDIKRWTPGELEETLRERDFKPLQREAETNPELQQIRQASRHDKASKEIALIKSVFGSVPQAGAGVRFVTGIGSGALEYEPDWQDARVRSFWAAQARDALRRQGKKRRHEKSMGTLPKRKADPSAASTAAPEGSPPSSAGS